MIGEFVESESVIDPAIIASYRTALYVLATVPRCTLRLDVPSEALAGIYAQYGVASASFLTACNPLGTPLSEDDNARRNAELEAILAERKLPFLHGAGIDAKGEWPAEASVLVLGIDLDAAKALGRRFEQNAILWCRADATPALVLLR
jgi:hypothetical protein